MVKTESIKTVKDLKVYVRSYTAAMEIFKITKKFPKEEVYSLTDQMRRASRSIAINIREGFAKRKYVNVFVRHINDALGSAEETRGWLEFSRDCDYITTTVFDGLDSEFEQICAMLFALMHRWEDFEKIEDAKQKIENRE